MSFQSSCPCTPERAYGQCCGRFHLGEVPATAELLMRSRYSAYVHHNVAYLNQTWHPKTRPQGLHLDPTTTWLGLQVLTTTAGGATDRNGRVSFIARYHDAAGFGQLQEESEFIRRGGRWCYLGPQA